MDAAHLSCPAVKSPKARLIIHHNWSRWKTKIVVVDDDDDVVVVVGELGWLSNAYFRVFPPSPWGRVTVRPRVHSHTLGDQARDLRVTTIAMKNQGNPINSGNVAPLNTLSISFNRRRKKKGWHHRSSLRGDLKQGTDVSKENSLGLICRCVRSPRKKIRFQTRHMHSICAAGCGVSLIARRWRPSLL